MKWYVEYQCGICDPEAKWAQKWSSIRQGHYGGEGSKKSYQQQTVEEILNLSKPGGCPGPSPEPTLHSRTGMCLELCTHLNMDGLQIQ